jgi:uncharacterized protein
MTTFTLAPVLEFLSSRTGRRKLGSRTRQNTGPPPRAPPAAALILAPVSPIFYLWPMKYLSLRLIALVSLLGLAPACAPSIAAAQVPGAQGPAAQGPAAEAPRTIHVSAQASVQRTPDRATVQLAVETIAETARDATNRNAAAMDRVLAALRELGIPDARIQTTRIALHPRYDQRRDHPEPAIVAYQAVNQVMVRLDDIGLVGRVVDAAVQAGANRVTGIHFELSEPHAAYHEALRLAVVRAGEEAAVVAAALGERLGPAMQVSTGGAQPPRARMEAAQMDMAVSAAPPVQPGEMEVHAMVSITYRLGP